jgi:hypothetical protein
LSELRALRRLLVLVILLWAAGCGTYSSEERQFPGLPEITRPSQEKRLPEWIGKDRKEVVKKLGEPTLAVPMESGGGEELYFSHEGHKYYFETNDKRDVKTAVQLN